MSEAASLGRAAMRIGSVPTRERRLVIVPAVVQQSRRLIMEKATFIAVYDLADIYGSAPNLVWKKRVGRGGLEKTMK